jgi:hypothetical protein
MNAPAERCPFIARCSKIVNICRNEVAPELIQPERATHRVACYNPVWQGLD